MLSIIDVTQNVLNLILATFLLTRFRLVSYEDIYKPEKIFNGICNLFSF